MMWHVFFKTSHDPPVIGPRAVLMLDGCPDGARPELHRPGCRIPSVSGTQDPSRCLNYASIDAKEEHPYTNPDTEMIQIRRIFGPRHSDDGFRILVDRLWPRGLSKTKAHVDLWLRDIAPSDDLRKRFSHDPDRWKEFRTGYRKELTTKKGMLEQLRALEREKRVVTLLYAASDEEHNNAVVLEAILRARRGRRRSVGPS